MRFLGSLAALCALALSVHAANPPIPPTEFAEPQSPPKPEPFAIKYVDQGQFDLRLKGMLVPEGFKTEIVADEKLTINPVGMTFLPDGTLVVLEWSVDPITGNKWFEFKETFRYRDGSTKLVATMRKFTSDPVKLLKRDSSGQFVKAETIISEELPSTVLYHDGWLYMTGRGTVRRYRQSRPNGPWDIRETIAQGFCGFHHHQVSGLTIGLDGKLYITSGDDDNFVEGSDGSRANALRTGAIFRCNLDGSQMETYSLGYRNPYRDIAYDTNYNFFHADNDNEDGSKFTGCRLLHVAEEADFGWRLFPGARCCRPDFTRGAVAGELPGKLPPMLKTGRGAPAGVLIYNDTALPEHYRGLMYYPDVYRKNIRAYKLRETGSTFEVTHEFELMKSPEDPLFRPCQMITGPDGAIYICDWRTDSGGAGRLSGDGKNGRIYRLSWVGTKTSPAYPTRDITSWAKLAALPLPELADVLNSPNQSERNQARYELVKRGAPARDKVLRKLVSGKFNDLGRIEALGVLEPHYTTSPSVADQFKMLLQDESPTIRRLAVEAIGRRSTWNNPSIREHLAQMLQDDAAAVRRAAALALGKIKADGAAEMLINAWRQETNRDLFLSDAYLRGLERLGKPGMDALLQLAKSGNAQDLDRVTAAFLTFRTESAVKALPEVLTDPHLPAEQRAALLKSYTNYLFDPPMPMDQMTKFVTSRSADAAPVRMAGVEILASTGQLTKPEAVSFVLAQLDAPEPEARQAAMDAVVSARLTQATDKLINQLADTKRPVAERTQILKALRTSAGTAAVKPLSELLDRAEPVVLKLEALRALATASPDQAKAVATKLLDDKDPALVNEAIILLGTNKAGAQLLGERFVAKKLSKDTYPRITETLQKFSSDPAIAKLYGEVMKGGLLVSLDPKRLEETKKLVATKGDAMRGKAVYLNTKVVACASCHRMEGVGGAVGPDLTRLWDTHSVEKILEPIVDPHKEIKEGYQSYKAVTVSGQVYTGLKVSENAQAVTIREATGRDVRIAKTDLDELNTTKLSLMPDNAVSQLSLDEFIDLLAFLKSKTAQESLRGVALDFQVLVGESKLLKTAADWETNLAQLPTKNLQPATADPSGVLNLAPFFTNNTPTGTYVLFYIHSTKAQSARLNLLADSDLRVLVDGLVIHSGTEEPKVTALNKTLAVSLKAGWTPVLIKVGVGGKTQTLKIQAFGESLRLAAKPD
jgi:quinoprotein glucose dehydrogenase